MAIKVLLLILVAAVILHALFWPSQGKRTAEREARRQGEDNQDEAATRDGDALVACAKCQLRLPESESLMAAGRHYCCDEHRRLDEP